MKCTVKLSSHNTNYCLIEVVTKAGLTVIRKKPTISIIKWEWDGFFLNLNKENENIGRVNKLINGSGIELF